MPGALKARVGDTWIPIGSALNTGEFRQTVENKGTVTSYTLALADEYKLLLFSAATSITLTVPPLSSVAFPVGARVDFVQIAAGRITVSAPGLTLYFTPSATLRTAGSAASLIKIAAPDTWLLSGDLA